MSYLNYSELKPDAIYRLTEDVKNPHADRRRKRQANMLPVWKKGTRFLAREQVFENTVGDVEVRIIWFILEFVDHKYGAMYGIPAHEDDFKKTDKGGRDTDRANAIMASLEPAEEDFTAFLSRVRIEDYTMMSLVKRLCAKGVLTHKQIEDEYNIWMNEPDED
jgi:hypothetical protein